MSQTIIRVWDMGQNNLHFN